MNQKQLSENGDDFRQITGIGPVTARRLFEAGIETYAQLTAVSPQALADHLTGISPERIIKEDWLGQAEKLAQTQAMQTSDNGQHYATFTVELLLDEDNTVRRTRIVHVQQEEQKESWAGWQPERLQTFITQYASLVKHQPAKAEEDDAQPAALQAKVLDEMTMRFVPSAKTTAVPPTTKPVKSTPTPLPQPLSIELNTPNVLLEHGHSFNVQLYLDLAQLSHDGQTPLNYQAAIYAAQLGSGSRQKVGAAYGAINNTAVDKFAITVPTQIASPGTYRLEAEMAVAWIPATPDLTANSTGGLLHVY